MSNGCKNETDFPLLQIVKVKTTMGEVVPGVEEALALDPRSGVRRVKRRLTIRLNKTALNKCFDC